MEEYFISYSCIFISYIQCFEVSFQKSGYFSKKLFFQNFDWSNLIFDQSKSCLKKFSEPLPGSIDRTCFSINRTSRFRYFKNSSLTDSNIFFKSFFKLFSLFPTWQGSTKFFCRFLPKFLQGFPPSRPVRPFYPSFCSYFHVFMHFFMHLKGIFKPP